MYSSRDLESFYFQYQTESLSHGESLQSFCLKHKVPYNISHKWYKDHHEFQYSLSYFDVKIVQHVKHFLFYYKI